MCFLHLVVLSSLYCVFFTVIGGIRNIVQIVQLFVSPKFWQYMILSLGTHPLQGLHKAAAHGDRMGIMHIMKVCAELTLHV